MQPVFDFQGSASPGERLVLTERSPWTRLLIGHENSVLHPRTVFRLHDSTERTAVR